MSKAWNVRPFFYKQERNYAKDFIKGGIIAIAPQNSRNLKGLSVDEIKRAISTNAPRISSIALGRLANIVYSFIYEMSIGDLAIMIDGNDLYVMEVASDYIHEVNLYGSSNFFSMTRKVNILKRLDKRVLKSDLGIKLRSGRQVQDISEFYDDVYALAYSDNPIEKTAPASEALAVPISYRIRPDFEIKFEVPRDISEDEARRFKEFIGNLYFK